jgi:hypothetical protein
MTRCPTHNTPLVRTHGGSLICFKCYFAQKREQRNGWQRTDAGTRHEGNGGNHTRGDARHYKKREKVAE